MSGSQSPATLKLRAFIDAVLAIAWSSLPDGSLDFINQRFRDYTGLSSDELTGLKWKSAVHPDDIQKLETWWQHLSQSQEAATTEKRLRRFDGVYRWFQIAAAPVHDEQANLVRWCGINTDIDDLKRTEEGLRASERSWRQIIDCVPGFVCTATAAGEVEFFNQQSLNYFGKTLEDLKSWTTMDVIHPADLPQVITDFRHSIETGQPWDIVHRLRRADGVYRWFQSRGLPQRDAEGRIIRWFGLLADIDDRKHAEEELKRSEEFLAEGQRLSRTGSFSWCVETNEIIWSEQLYRIFELDKHMPVTLERIGTRVYPDDLPLLGDMIEQARQAASDFEYQHRLLMPDSSVRHIHLFAHATRDKNGRLEYVGAAQDVTHLHTITDAIANPIVVLTPDGTTLYANRVGVDQLVPTSSKAKNEGLFMRACHPDDVDRARDECRVGLAKGIPFELEMRLRRNGEYRWHIAQYNPLRDERGQIIRWYCTATDIDDRKRAEQQLRQSEEDLRTITDAIRQSIVVLAPDGTTLYANRVALDLTGLTVADVNDIGFFARVFHPEDVERVREERSVRLLEGVPFDLEMRALFKSGEYRWQLVQYDPQNDEHGRPIRWYVTGTDLDERKRAEERLRNENFVLREEIDRTSMFEEIVGSSKRMREVLKQVEKVAPSDSTVLILGETGTGKELIARALHRRSKRATRAFVRVNCAAIPQSLIASELFGHEKGAFTGALQRRVGRFEAADGGTLFLDEIGDLPMETQIALLRVLQEKEFERVGSTHPVCIDVRVIAATNRDLPAAVAAGTFRQDLFYRLNVVPIAVPPLRERAEDIPLLVEYFVGRFAKAAGKDIRHISKNTLEQLRGYRWPGNIRELQNVVERAVTLSETDSFVVEESWLKSESADLSPHEGLSALANREVEMIEAALAESHGRISGPSGAAAKLGIPRQTLESKIRRLGIDKYGKKRPSSE